MNSWRLRKLIRKHGNPGYVIVGLYLLGYYLFKRQRVKTGVVLAALSLFALFAPRFATRSYCSCANVDVTGETQSYKVTDMGELPGSEFTVPFSVNDSGMVTGAAIMENDEIHSFVWQHGRYKDLGSLGGKFTLATHINNRGAIVGMSQASNDYLHAFLWQNGKMQDLSPAADDSNGAESSNDQNQVVGWTDTGKTFEAATWQNGKLKKLGILPGDSISEAFAINNRGDIVGGSGTTQTYRPFAAYRGAGIQPLPMPGKNGIAVAINDAGLAVGVCEIGKETYHAFVSKDDKTADLGTLGGDYSSASGISASNQIIGFSINASGDGRAFLWQKGKMTDLTDLLPSGSGWTMSTAYAISGRGLITGIGYRQAKFRPYLLTPISN